jgi:deoxyadenosine/deoxycytidine kinase
MVDKELPFPRFIVISGLIGVGKTTFAESLANYLGYEPIYEPVDDNPYLERFYREPNIWAYPMQEYLKHRRFAAYQFAIWGIRCGRFNGIVMDRSIHEDTVFAEINQKIGTINELNWKTYLQGFQDFQIFLPEPDVYVYLDATPEACRERILKRARPAEQKTGFDGEPDDDTTGIPLDYLRTLHQGYQDWLQEIAPRIPTVKLDWSRFKDTPSAWKWVKSQIDNRSRFTRSLVV